MFDREAILVDSKVLTRIKLCRSLWINLEWEFWLESKWINYYELISSEDLLLNFNRSRTSSIKILLEVYGMGFCLDSWNFCLLKKIFSLFWVENFYRKICFADHSIIPNLQDHSNTIISSRCFLSFYFSSFIAFYSYFHHFPLFLLF